MKHSVNDLEKYKSTDIKIFIKNNKAFLFVSCETNNVFLNSLNIY